MHLSVPIVERPDHVPEDLVHDVNIYDTNTTDDDWHLNFKRKIQGPQMPDVFWTPHNGGHWIAARGSATKEVLSDAEHFSSSQLVPNVAMNPTPPFVPLMIDPPDHKKYRDLLMPALTPKAVESLGKDARELAISLIEGFKDKGECEFIGDFATHLPIAIFMSMTNLPEEDRPALLEIADGLVRSTSPEGYIEGAMKLNAYASKLIDERRANPGDDLISRLAVAEVDGAPLDDDKMMGMVTLLLLAGLDTVASMMGFFARFLALNPDYRKQLADNPAIIKGAVEELLRRHPVALPGRKVVKDITLGGAPLKAGDMIVTPTMAYGLDDRLFDDPDVVDFARPRPIHETFGDGLHRCMGSMLARVELQIFIEEWLQRIPEFSIKPGESVHMTGGSVAAIKHLPLAWDLQ